MRFKYMSSHIKRAEHRSSGVFLHTCIYNGEKCPDKSCTSIIVVNMNHRPLIKQFQDCSAPVATYKVRHRLTIAPPRSTFDMLVTVEIVA